MGFFAAGLIGWSVPSLAQTMPGTTNSAPSVNGTLSPSPSLPTRAGEDTGLTTPTVPSTSSPSTSSSSGGSMTDTRRNTTLGAPPFNSTTGNAPSTTGNVPSTTGNVPSTTTSVPLPDQTSPISPAPNAPLSPSNPAIPSAPGGPIH